MNWIEIDMYDENANVPEVEQEILCYHKTYDRNFDLAIYMGFNEQLKGHIFHLRWGDGPIAIIKVTHWRELEKPE